MRPSHHFVLACAVAAALLGGCATSPPALQEPGQWTGSPVVRTRFGLAQGFPDNDDSLVWNAIP